MLKVISFKICPFFQYVTAMLKAKHIPFEVEYADFNNCLFDISPNGKAPIVITENNTVLFDADAIVNYLDKQYSGLLQPRSAEDIALLEAWANYGSKQYVPQCSTMRSVDEAEFKQHWGVFEKALINMEKQLGSSVFFFGDELSRVDIAWLPILHRAWLVKKTTGHDMFRDFPNIKRWQENIIKLDWLMETVSEDFEEVFNRFYLSNTFLSNV
ncbi:glutathione S-transferase family protein [Vibrio owensii]|uniref:glutathione S-transferase family protein n=1 Tax=Vibrio owensii TaxID=696485 RepID=UPI003748FBF1